MTHVSFFNDLFFNVPGVYVNILVVPQTMGPLGLSCYSVHIKKQLNKSAIFTPPPQHAQPLVSLTLYSFIPCSTGGQVKQSVVSASQNIIFSFLTTE